MAQGQDRDLSYGAHLHRTWSRRVGKAQISSPGLFGGSPEMLHVFVFFFPLLIFPAVIICLTGRKDSH